MKYIGVSAPAWTITGTKRIEKQQKQEEEDGPLPAAPTSEQENKTKEQLYPTAPKWTINGAKSASYGQLPRPHTTSDDIKGKDKGSAALLNPQRWRETVHISTKFSRTGMKEGKKNTEKDFITPGPAHYNINNKEGDPSLTMPNFTFAYKQDTTTGQDINPLAPNHYNPKFSQKEIARYSSFSKSKKISLEDLGVGNPVPGPGSYKVFEERPNTSSMRGTFGKSTRNDLYKYKPACNPTADDDYKVNQHTIEFKAQQFIDSSKPKNE